ncbi:hypothetical protein Hamer_G009218 [Homarus americanus]|uniref:Uncharacterized protein n=1 Tax=Homarus americanus TaxID=6706 RepID=A0A8J5NB90_HOMAM|nr:hypothetical protein Hamer_G009218 [Homarus americanus]
MEGPRYLWAGLGRWPECLKRERREAGTTILHPDSVENVSDTMRILAVVILCAVAGAVEHFMCALDTPT